MAKPAAMILAGSFSKPTAQDREYSMARPVTLAFLLLCQSCGAMFGPTTTERLETNKIFCKADDIAFTSKSGSCEISSSNFFTGQPEKSRHGLPLTQSCRLLPDGESIAAGSNECIIGDVKLTFDPSRMKATITRPDREVLEIDCTSDVSTNSNLGATSGQSCEDVY